MNVDIYALCEVGEGRTAVQDIVNGLNEAEGTDKYAYIDSGDSHENTYTTKNSVPSARTLNSAMWHKLLI